MKAKFKIHEEMMWIIGMIVMPFAVTLCTKADLGMSMIAAPTYIVSEKLDFLSYGQTEYIFQAIVLIIMCIMIRKFKFSYLLSFVSAVVYGTILDFYIWLMSDVVLTQLWVKVVFLVLGMVLTSFGVACFIKSYIPPCAYDYLVKMVVQERKFNLKKFKLANDFAYLVLSIVLTLVLFSGLVGVGFGTVLMAVCNGFIISFFSKMIEKHCDISPRFSKIKNLF